MANLNPYFWFSGYDFVDDTDMTSTVVTADSVQEAINSAMSTIKIDENGNLVVDGTVIGEVEAGSVIENIELDENDDLVITYKLETGETKTITTSLAKLVDVYTGGEGINVEDNTISINDEQVATQEELDTAKADLEAKIADCLTKADADEAYQAKGDYATSDDLASAKADLEIAIQEVKDSALTKEEADEAYQTKGDYATADDLATTKSDLETAINEVKDSALTKEEADEAYQAKGDYATAEDLEKYATADDLATAKADLETAIQEVKDSALTKEEADEAYQAKGDYATAEDLASAKEAIDTINDTIESTITPAIDENTKQIYNDASAITSMEATIAALQAQIESLLKTNVVKVDLTNLSGNLDDSTADYVLSGELTSTVDISGKSITLDNTVATTADNRLNLTAKDITINGSTINGEYNKSNGNRVIKIEECQTLTIQNLTFSDSYSGYNGIEVALNSSTCPKSILIDNCEFSGTFSNNAISIFGVEDDSIITLSNCHFAKISNGLRLSNKTNAKNTQINVVNCTVDEWESDLTYTGFVVCQDYTSTTNEEAEENNLFGDGKIKIDFTNLVHAGEKVLPTDVASVCGSKDENQIIYVYYDKGGFIEYGADKYPTILFN